MTSLLNNYTGKNVFEYSTCDCLINGDDSWDMCIGGLAQLANAFASRAKEWEFESLIPHHFLFFANLNFNTLNYLKHNLCIDYITQSASLVYLDLLEGPLIACNKLELIIDKFLAD